MNSFTERKELAKRHHSGGRGRGRGRNNGGRGKGRHGVHANSGVHKNKNVRCKKCERTGHYANECHSKVCMNCKQNNRKFYHAPEDCWYKHNHDPAIMKTVNATLQKMNKAFDNLSARKATDNVEPTPKPRYDRRGDDDEADE